MSIPAAPAGYEAWAITFGLGTPFANRHTIIFTPIESPSHRVLDAAARAYGTRWAFEYSPDKVDDLVLKYGSSLREVLQVDADGDVIDVTEHYRNRGQEVKAP